jgi:hypothetical protein
MKRQVMALAISVGAVIAFSAPVLADEGRNESGKGWHGDYGGGNWRGEYYAEKSDYGRGNWRGKHFDERGPIPYGHLPPPGECRNWYDDLPPGHQPPPHRC